jgi:hypothetical protein
VDQFCGLYLVLPIHYSNFPTNGNVKVCHRDGVPSFQVLNDSSLFLVFNHNLPSGCSVLIDRSGRGRGVLKRLLWIDRITKGLCSDVDNGRSGRGRGVLRRSQDEGMVQAGPPPMSVRIIWSAIRNTELVHRDGLR